ncbi:G-protein coupled receptor 20-like [Poecilia formosa]|uniref:G-protein coupled receptor 20-like n=1 Tax=Poecilia formosa TaxID=48698 RepID=UPI000443EF80|nr:PREDICTED: G-protein coupled receptor 20-like [Poecilia formosa]
MDNLSTFHLALFSIIGISTLITVVAIVFACLLPKKQPAQVFVINLLVSDLIQLISLIVTLMRVGFGVLLIFFFFGFIASVGFMVCISLDRYLFIAKPMWYESRRKKLYTVLVCVAVWLLAGLFIVGAILDIIDDHYFIIIVRIFGIFLLLPLPCFIFFVAGTIKVVSGAHSVPADEKRRIVSIVVAILLIYILLFLPVIIYCLIPDDTHHMNVLFKVYSITVPLSPIADSMLYVFLRKGLVDKLLAPLCCCKLSNNQQTVTMDTVGETVRVRLNTETSADP